MKMDIFLVIYKFIFADNYVPVEFFWERFTANSSEIYRPFAANCAAVVANDCANCMIWAIIKEPKASANPLEINFKQENARYFAEKGAILQAEESTLTCETLLTRLHELIAKTPVLQRNMLALKHTEACGRIAKELVAVAKRDN